MEKKEFKAESKRLLDLMIHSIYTNREIFLRELISNASDATDKYYYNAMKKGETGINRDELPISISADKEARTLTIEDHGCGMTREELENNLGTIAKSGSLSFKQEHGKEEDVDIIGQFGVGFYSAFMVAKEVEVISRSEDAPEGYCWKSEGTEGYTIDQTDKAEHGTKIIMYLKDNTEEENYDEFLETYRLQNLVQKYSDYIRYPIKMDVVHTRVKEGTEDSEKKEYEDYTVNETINSMVPIWKKKKSEVTEEEYATFFKTKFYEHSDPLRVIRSSVEGITTYNALLFVPAEKPFNYYSKDFERGLQLYSNGVLIMEKCSDLLPEYFGFIRGIVDSADLSLNISREMLQHNRQLKVMANSLEKKIKSELENMLKNDREKYEKMFEEFGISMKFGMYTNYGVHKDVLKDLVMFHSSFSDKLTTLAEYVSRMKDDQKYIYYACGDSTAKLSMLPQAAPVKEKGYEVLYFTDDVDEFAIKILEKYQDKEFRNVAAGDLGLESNEEKEQIQKLTEENQSMLDALKEKLGDKVAAVKLTAQLENHPVCLSTQGGMSLEMEKVLNAMPSGIPMKAERVLEINAQHPVFETLKTVFAQDQGKIGDYADILYNNALLIEGLPIEDPVAYSNAVCNLLVK
jgi:molecular chaperone HtpG